MIMSEVSSRKLSAFVQKAYEDGKKDGYMKRKVEEELEKTNKTVHLKKELENIKVEIGAKVFDIQPTSDKYFDGVDDVMDIVSSIIDKHITELKGEQNEI